MEDSLTQLTWNTATLYPTPESLELEHDFAEGRSRVQAFRERYQGKVAALNAEGLKAALRECEALEELIVKPQLYAHLLFAADSGSDVHKTLSQRAAEYGNRLQRQSCPITGITWRTSGNSVRTPFRNGKRGS
jgi:oligoendopeptidase F